MMNRRIVVFRLPSSLLAVSMLVATQGVAAEPALPEGMIGWSYYTGITSPAHFTADPITACALSAQNHFRAPSLAMRAMPGTNTPIMECQYAYPGTPKDIQGDLDRIPANGKADKWVTVSPQPGYKGPKF
ncbi:MAG: hypothetical protein JWQ01_3815 [Massilia sp.]|jgi:hypothetical protein|nr:hypothetical protein [Massilia sp.]